MSDLLVRRVPQDAAAALKEQAASERRSATSEAAHVLTAFAAGQGADSQEARRKARERTIAASKYWQARLAGRDLGEDSTAITRHDRDTDHGRA